MDNVSEILEAPDAVEYLLNSDGQPVIPESGEHTESLEERLAKLPDLDISDLEEDFEDLTELTLALDQVELRASTERKGKVNANNPHDEPSLTFPFDRNDPNYTHPTKFVKKLYLEPDNWLDKKGARQTDADRWMNRRIGNPTLTAVREEPVENTDNPNWRWAESWRAIDTWETLRTLKEKHPVAKFLENLGKKDTDKALTKAMWPEALKSLLRDNETVIVKSKKDWVGRKVTSNKKYDPFPGVKVFDGGPSGMKYYQTGAVGPMCMQAAFILATQLAGINWETLRKRIKPENIAAGVYWDSAILVDKKGDENIIEDRKDGSKRTLGYLSRPPTTLINGPAGSPDAGFVLALDIDPDIDGFKKDKNVFIFASHLIDPHSRVYVPNQSKLRDMQYSTSYEPGTVIPPKGPTGGKGKDVYFFGHAHAAVMPYTDWQKWIGQNPKPGQTLERMPRYSQIGELHLYYLPEKEDSFWPRYTWLQNHPN